MKSKPESGDDKKRKSAKAADRTALPRAMDGAPHVGRDGLESEDPDEAEVLVHPDTAAFQEKRAVIEAVPKERAVKPYFSLLDGAVAALHLAEAAAPHRETFVGLDRYLPGVLDAFDSLPKLARAVRFIQTQYLNAQADEGQARIPEAMIGEGDELRALMLMVLGYNLRKDPAVAAAIERIRQGFGHRDRADDLEALATLYDKHADTLARDLVHYDKRHAVRARKLSVDMGHLLDRAQGGTAGEWSRLRAKGTPLLLEYYDRVMRAMISIDFSAPMDEYPTFHVAVRALQGPRSTRRATDDVGTPEVDERTDVDVDDNEPGSGSDGDTPPG